MTADLRTRIAAAIDQKYNEEAIGHTYEVCLHAADAVIRELDDKFLDFALWLSEEITGKPMNRIDAESCLKDWKGTDDE